MKRIILTAAALAAIAVSGSAAKNDDLRCSLTGKVISACCCTKAAHGNLHCTLADRDIKACCCRAAGK